MSAFGAFCASSFGQFIESPFGARACAACIDLDVTLTSIVRCSCCNISSHAFGTWNSLNPTTGTTAANGTRTLLAADATEAEVGGVKTCYWDVQLIAVYGYTLYQSSNCSGFPSQTGSDDLRLRVHYLPSAKTYAAYIYSNLDATNFTMMHANSTLLAAGGVIDGTAYSNSYSCGAATLDPYGMTGTIDDTYQIGNSGTISAIPTP